MITPEELAMIADATAGSIRTAMAKLEEKLAAEYERKLREHIAQLPAGPKGEKGDPGESIRGEKGEPGERGEKGDSIIGAPGNDADPVDVDALILRVAELVPKAENGKDGAPGRDGIDGKDGERGTDGKDAPPVDVKAIEEAILSRIPKPQDGRDADPALIQQFISSEVERAVSELPKAKDGERGERGEPGPDGKSVELSEVEALARKAVDDHASQWELDFERRAQDLFQRVIDRLPKPKDGRDGLGFEDLDVTHDGDGNVTFLFKRGELEKAFTVRFPRQKFKGVYRQGEAYREGDDVTVDGSRYTALEDNPSDRPGTGKGWQLSVKKGRDGKDLRSPEPPKPQEPVRLK